MFHLPSSSSLSNFLPSLLPVKILGVLGFVFNVLNSISFAEDDEPVPDDDEQDQDQDSPVQNGLASESSLAGG